MVEKVFINGNIPFSDAIKVGNTVYVNGTIPKDPISGKMAETCQDQMILCLENIKKILEKAGGKISNIVKVTVFLTNIKDYGIMNKTYIDFFKSNGVEKNFPVRSTVQVGPLMYKDWFVEIDCIAII